MEICIGEPLSLFLDFIMENVMLDLKCNSVFLEHWFSMKVSYSSDQYSISLLDSSFVFLLAHNILARVKLEHIQVVLLLPS
jgi:hypothetical protein